MTGKIIYKLVASPMWMSKAKRNIQPSILLRLDEWVWSSHKSNHLFSPKIVQSSFFFLFFLFFFESEIVQSSKTYKIDHSDYSAHSHDTIWPTQRSQKLQINVLNFSQDMSHMKTVATVKSTSPQNVITKMLFYIQIPKPRIPYKLLVHLHLHLHQTHWSTPIKIKK